MRIQNIVETLFLCFLFFSYIVTLPGQKQRNHVSFLYFLLILKICLSTIFYILVQTCYHKNGASYFHYQNWCIAVIIFQKIFQIFSVYTLLRQHIFLNFSNVLSSTTLFHIFLQTSMSVIIFVSLYLMKIIHLIENML